MLSTNSLVTINAHRDYSSLACDEFQNSIALYCDQLCYSEDNAEFLADSLFKELSDDLDLFAPTYPILLWRLVWT